MDKQEMIKAIADALQAGRINLEDARTMFEAISRYFAEQA